MCADALAASQTPPALDDQALMADAAAQMQQIPAAGAAPAGAPMGLSEAAARPGNESFMDIPAGAAMTVGALPLLGDPSAGSMHVPFGTCNTTSLRQFCSRQGARVRNLA